MKATLVDHMGTDLSVVNAARVSFAKGSEWEKISVSCEEVDKYMEAGWRVRETFYTPYSGADLIRLSERDTKLINYLARHKHWTPFAHTAITVHVKAPLFVARQLGKHQVGMVWNEVSRRYVTEKPEFYVPDIWRKAADNVKQGSSDEPVEWHGGMSSNLPAVLMEQSVTIYNRMVNEEGICPELARMVLPQATYTEWVWTGNLVSFANMWKLRTDSHTQRETQEVARQIGDLISPLFPVSWKALTNAT